MMNLDNFHKISLKCLQKDLHVWLDAVQVNQFNIDLCNVKNSFVLTILGEHNSRSVPCKMTFLNLRR